MAKVTGLTQEELEALRAIDSGTVANAVDSFGERERIAGFASLELRCLNPNLPPVVGYAVTCTEDVTTSLRRPRESYEALLRAIEETPKPAIVVFKALGQDRLRSCHVGDMMCTLLQRMGVVAVVTDGAARDLKAVRERAPDFQLFAAGMVPAGGDYTMFDVGGQVSICGLRIAPGDLLHGDVNGLLSIPSSVARRVPEKARQIREFESSFVEFVNGPDFSVAELGRRFGPPWG